MHFLSHQEGDIVYKCPMFRYGVSELCFSDCNKFISHLS